MRSIAALTLAICIPTILEASELQPILLTGDSLPNGSESKILVGILDVAVNRIGNVLVYGRFDSDEEMRSANVWFADSANGLFEQLDTSGLDISDEDDTRIRLSSDGAIVEFAEYSGGHGWRENVYGDMRKGIEWLEKAE